MKEPNIETLINKLNDYIAWNGIREPKTDDLYPTGNQPKRVKLAIEFRDSLNRKYYDK